MHQIIRGCATFLRVQMMFGDRKSFFSVTQKVKPKSTLYPSAELDFRDTPF